MKFCSQCKVEKVIEDFSKNKSNKTTGRSASCKECKNKYSAKWRSENAELHRERARKYGRENPRKVKNSILKRSYGLSLEGVEHLLALQNNRCDTCLIPIRILSGNRDNNAYVDHCHKTGKVRGILCGNCNVALGLVEDNPKILEAMIQYLKKE